MLQHKIGSNVAQVAQEWKFDGRLAQLLGARKLDALSLLWGIRQWMCHMMDKGD